MARLNIDEDMFTDPRVVLLKEKISEVKAYGCLVILWRLGQQYWKKKGGPFLIPKPLFLMIPHHKELIECSMAEFRENGVYCCGAEERWEYLKIDAKVSAGKKSAQARKNKYGTSSPIKRTTTRTEHEQTRTDTNITHTHTHTKENTYTSKASFDPQDIKPNIESKNTLGDVSKNETHWLVELWNNNCKNLSKVIKITGRRRRSILSRIKDEPDPKKWKLAIQKITESKFCCGEIETNKTNKPWRANFDWLLKPDTLVKILEGQYDDKMSVSKKMEFGPRKEWDMSF